MKQLKFVNLVFLFLLFSIHSIAQLTLGEATFSYARAKPILRSEAIISILNSPRYLAKIGGVAFDKVAIPAEGLYVSDLKLNYNPYALDGKRFSVFINGIKAGTNIYDWELVPIAKYANSSHNACFTLFGDLEDSEKAKTIQEKGGRILNYHQAFANTLLGLRLFQLDILIIQPTLSTDLPKNSNKYLLGNGEKSPDILSNRIGYNKYNSFFEKNEDDYRSYLICDQNRTIKFGIQNNLLFITGQPFYYFFRYNTDDVSYKNVIINNIQNESLQVQKNARTEFEKNNKVEKWLLNKIHDEYTVLDPSNFQADYSEFLKDVNGLKAKKGMKIYLEELKYMLADLKTENSPKKVVYLKNLSTTLSNQPQLFRNINPAVWDAGVNTMRYSAFFRYCKTRFPEQWKIFMAQINRIDISPYVSTPTVMNFDSK